MNRNHTQFILQTQTQKCNQSKFKKIHKKIYSTIFSAQSIRTFQSKNIVFASEETNLFQFDRMENWTQKSGRERGAHSF